MYVTVREIITIKGWTEGSGWDYATTYSDQILEVPQSFLATDADIDWSWWENDDNQTNDTDTRIIVEYYDPNEDPDDAEPMARWETWASEIRDLEG